MVCHIAVHHPFDLSDQALPAPLIRPDTRPHSTTRPMPVNASTSGMWSNNHQPINVEKPTPV